MRRRDLLGGAGRLAGLAGLAQVPGIRQSRLVAAQEATPTGSPGDNSLAEMLLFAPAALLGNLDDGGPLATFADFGAQLAAVGVAAPEGRDDPGLSAWRAVISEIRAFPDGGRAFYPEWRETFGWGGFAVTRFLEISTPPATTTVLAGAFDRTEIGAALTAQGYDPVDIPGADAAWSSSPDATVNLDSDAGRLAFSHMNTVALLADGFLVTGGVLDLVALAVATASGDGKSLADTSELLPLLDAQDPPLVSAMVVPGGALAGGLDPAVMLSRDGTPQSFDDIATEVAEAEAARAALPAMPVIVLALFGTTAGVPPPGEEEAATPLPLPAGAPPARSHFIVRFVSEAAAAEAVPIIDGRLATESSVLRGYPWSALVDGWRIVAIPGTPVVRVELETEARGLWHRLLAQRDLGFLSW